MKLQHLTLGNIVESYEHINVKSMERNEYILISVVYVIMSQEQFVSQMATFYFRDIVISYLFFNALTHTDNNIICLFPI